MWNSKLGCLIFLKIKHEIHKMIIVWCHENHSKIVNCFLWYHIVVPYDLYLWSTRDQTNDENENWNKMNSSVELQVDCCPMHHCTNQKESILKLRWIITQNCLQAATEKEAAVTENTQVEVFVRIAVICLRSPVIPLIPQLIGRTSVKNWGGPPLFSAEKPLFPRISHKITPVTVFSSGAEKC